GVAAHLSMEQFSGLAHSGFERWLEHALHEVKPIMIFVSAGLPALGAALAGIRVQGDFEGSQLGSELTSEALKSLRRDYRSALDHELNLDETADMLIRTARLMSEDLDAWQDLYGRKRLTLPA